MKSAFKRNSHDIYFAHHHMVPGKPEFDYRILDRTQLHLYINKSMLSTIDMDDWSAIAKHPFISTSAENFTLSGHINKICANRRIAPNIINYYNRADTALLAVNAGIGVAILPPHMHGLYNCPDVVALPIEGEDAVIEMVVAWQKNSISQDVEHFLKLDALNEICSDG